MGSHSPNDCSRFTDAEVVVWLPGLIAAEAVSQSSIVIYGLANVCCNSVSECSEREPSYVIWDTVLTSLCLGFLICEMGMLIVPVSEVNTCQVLEKPLACDE